MARYSPTTPEAKQEARRQWYRRKRKDAAWVEKRRQGAREYRRKMARARLLDPALDADCRTYQRLRSYWYRHQDD